MPKIWTLKEKRLLDRLDTPIKIQSYIDSLEYDPEGGYKSPRTVMKERKAQCFSGAIMAAAAFQHNGMQPLIVDLLAQNDDDHVLAVFKKQKLWGTVAKSNCTTLRFREPVYRSLRELSMSYFDVYFNVKGEKTLRAYSVPLNLMKFGYEWLVSERYPHPIDDAIERVQHYPLISKRMAKSLEMADKKLLEASLMGSNPAGLYKPK